MEIEKEKAHSLKAQTLSLFTQISIKKICIFNSLWDSYKKDHVEGTKKILINPRIYRPHSQHTIP